MIQATLVYKKSLRPRESWPCLDQPQAIMGFQLTGLLDRRKEVASFYYDLLIELSNGHFQC